MPLCPHRCDGGVLRVRCGGVPRLPDVAHHRGTDAGVLGERQNGGAALPTSPVGHAASSQARMQRQTATGAVRTHSSTTLLRVHDTMRQLLKCRQGRAAGSPFLPPPCRLFCLFLAPGIHRCKLIEGNAPLELLYALLSVIVRAQLELSPGPDRITDHFNS